MDEQELTTRIASGDTAALRETYDACARELFMFALTLTKGNEADAEDVLQECFVRVWENRRRLTPGGSLRGYLFTALRNIFLNLRRTESREMKRRSRLVEGPPDAEADVDEINKALDVLPEEQREVVVLRIWGELTLAETAGVLGIPEGTAASRYRYAIAKLRQQLAS